MSAQHTPTPWAYRPNEFDDWGWIRAANGDLVAVAKASPWLTAEDFTLFREIKSDPAIANAAFIVRACNSHDALVEALTKLISAAKLLQANSEGCAVNHYGNDIELFGLPGWLADTEKAIEAARAALKLAAGQP